jgi:hypothetical protein
VAAVQNAIKQYWDMSQNTKDNREKIQAIEHYLECHKVLWTLLYGGEDSMIRFGNKMPQQQQGEYDDTFIV